MDNNLSDFKVDSDYMKSVHNNASYNSIIIEYYKKLASESREVDDLSIDLLKKKNRVSSIVNFKNPYVLKDRKIDNIYAISKTKIANLEKCNKFWYMNVYDHSQIKDFISTNLCHDKFCNNCKKVKQAARMSRYIPYLEKYSDSLYHLVLTIPSIPGNELKETIGKMNKSFQQLVRYLSLRSKLGFVNLSKYGYRGAVRSLEITFKDDFYHPHFHVAIVLNKDINLEGKYRNSYSTDYYGNRGERLFSEFEIIVQKLWYLCYNNISVNANRFNELEQGYSCQLDKFDANAYVEVFKYMTKATDEKNYVLTYDNFKTLYFSTFYVRQIQGYGCLYQISDKNLDEEIDKIYADIKYFLTSEDKGYSSFERPIDLLNDKNYTIISRKKIYKYLKELK